MSVSHRVRLAQGVHPTGTRLIDPPYPLPAHGVDIAADTAPCPLTFDTAGMAPLSAPVCVHPRRMLGVLHFCEFVGAC